MTKALTQATAKMKAARTATPQRVRTPGRADEVRNDSGGYVFKVSDADRFMRFLIIGTEGGTTTAGKREFTDASIAFVRKYVKANEAQALDAIVRVSDEGRSYTNSPALFALAVIMTEGVGKAAAREAVKKVARTSTHLFEFAQHIDNLGGWGRAKRAAVAGWFTSKTPEQLAYQAVKYRSRSV